MNARTPIISLVAFGCFAVIILLCVVSALVQGVRSRRRDAARFAMDPVRPLNRGEDRR
jgi:hypothetical protein